MNHYRLEGQLLEVCDCQILCPCWVGEDPDNGTCNTAIAWHIDSGTIQQIDVSGLTICLVGHVPGNILNGNIRGVFLIDDNATKQQESVLVETFTGQLGGPIADFARLLGDVIGIQREPITFEVHQGRGKLIVGKNVKAELEPFIGPNGRPTTLQNTMFSTIPGTPAFVGKAPVFQLNNSELGLNIDIQDHNAIQGQFLFEG